MILTKAKVAAVKYLYNIEEVNGLRILLAEDERSLSRAITALLERSNYSVDPVYDGVEALDYLAGGNYDALILDIMMPKMDGMEVLYRLRAQGGIPSPFCCLPQNQTLLTRSMGLIPGQTTTSPNRLPQPSCWPAFARPPDKASNSAAA